MTLLADGTRVEIRLLASSDRPAVADLHARASDDSIYKRFFTASRWSAQDFVDGLYRPGSNGWSLVALRYGQLVGLGTAFDGLHGTSEIAVLVEEALHGVGIGTVLLEQLARGARQRGVRTFTAEVLTSNSGMLTVFHDLGFPLTEHRDHDVVTVSLDLTPSRESVASSTRRQEEARSASLGAGEGPHGCSARRHEGPAR